MAEAARLRMTAEEFLGWEEKQPDRHELVDGVVRLMSGGTAGHNIIADNIQALLRARLKASGCSAFRADMKVRAPAGDVMYPDVVVTFSPVPRLETALSEPVAVVEVLSPSTARHDDTDKRWSYQDIPSLRHLVLVAQDRPRLEVASRGPDGLWTSMHVIGLGSTLRLEVLAVELAMAEIYEGVEIEGS